MKFTVVATVKVTAIVIMIMIMMNDRLDFFKTCFMTSALKKTVLEITRVPVSQTRIIFNFPVCKIHIYSHVTDFMVHSDTIPFACYL